MKGFLGWKFSCLLWHSGYIIASMSYMVYPEVKAKTLISKQRFSQSFIKAVNAMEWAHNYHYTAETPPP